MAATCVECGALAVAKQRCEKHYRAWKRKHTEPGDRCTYCRRTIASTQAGKRREGKTLTLDHWPVTVCRRCFPLVLERYREENLSRLAQVTTPDPWAQFMDCWTVWRLNESGYAQITPAHVREKVYAHHMSYALFVGGYPQGRQIHHRCHTRNCVNPAHLEALTAKQHHARMKSKPTGKALPSFLNSDGGRMAAEFARVHGLPFNPTTINRLELAAA